MQLLVDDCRLIRKVSELVRLERIMLLDIPSCCIRAIPQRGSITDVCAYRVSHVRIRDHIWNCMAMTRVEGLLAAVLGGSERRSKEGSAFIPPAW